MPSKNKTIVTAEPGKQEVFIPANLMRRVNWFTRRMSTRNCTCSGWVRMDMK